MQYKCTLKRINTGSSCTTTEEYLCVQQGEPYYYYIFCPGAVHLGVYIISLIIYIFTYILLKDSNIGTDIVLTLAHGNH